MIVTNLTQTRRSTHKVMAIFGSKGKKEELEREEFRKEVDVAVEALKLEKKKKAIAQKRDFARINSIVNQYGLDGVWFLALGGFEDKRSES